MVYKMSPIDKPSFSASRGSFPVEMMFPTLKEKEEHVLPGEVIHSEQKDDT